MRSDEGRVALLAIGGYGRGELAPQSDLDLLLVHDLKARKVAKEVEPLASAIWYPLWDAGVKLGHAVRVSTSNSISPRPTLTRRRPW